MSQCPRYMDKSSTQTLREGLEEYYALHPGFTHPSVMPPDLGKLWHNHDVGHVIYGCGTDIYGEAKILLLALWTSDYTLQRHFEALKHPSIANMFGGVVEDRGRFWLYRSVLSALVRLVVELVPIWFKNPKRQKLVPHVQTDPLLDRSLLEIRQEFNLLPFIN